MGPMKNSGPRRIHKLIPPPLGRQSPSNARYVEQDPPYQPGEDPISYTVRARVILEPHDGTCAAGIGLLELEQDVFSIFIFFRNNFLQKYNFGFIIYSFIPLLPDRRAAGGLPPVCGAAGPLPPPAGR